MYTKLIGFLAIAALSIMLVTTATPGSAFAHSHHHHHGGSSNSQSLAQSNSCSGKCSNIGSQIQGDGNSVAISSSQ
ncbi:MAG TPA: hypothetical protein VH500_13570 [Nitrososphaeraceae archaeon]|jgi:hypothetical protein